MQIGVLKAVALGESGRMFAGGGLSRIDVGAKATNGDVQRDASAALYGDAGIFLTGGALAVGLEVRGTAGQPVEVFGL